MIFAIDECAELLLASGFNAHLGMGDRDRLKSVLLHYKHKVKAEMDQFIEGLAVLGVLQCNPSLMKCFFLMPKHKFTAGSYNSNHKA